MNTNTELKSNAGGPLKYELLLFFASIIWGSTFVAQQIGMQNGMGPMTFNAFRFSLGCIALVPVVIWRKRTTAGITPHGRLPVKWILAAGLFLFGAASFQQAGLLYTTSANSGFITAFYILFVPLIGLFSGRKATVILWMAILVCLVGFYLLSVTEKFSVSKGDLLTLVCALLWACQILTIDRIADKADPVIIALLQCVVCAVLSALAGTVFEDCTLRQVRESSGAIAYAGIMSVGVAFTLQVICQKHCPPAPAAVIMSMEAVFAAIAGYLVLNQILGPRAIIGCVMIFCGVLMAQLGPIIGKKMEN